MLGRFTRHQYRSLLDAAVFSDHRPDDPAIIFVQTGQESQTISRRQFREQVQQSATALRHLGMEAGDVLVIAHLQNLESIFAFWGALWIGAIPSMFPTLTERLDADHYIRNLAQLVERSGVRAVFTTDDFAPQLRAQLPCPVFDGHTLSQNLNNSNLIPATVTDEAEIAFLQHSSGTTGLQKGVALSHQAVLNQLASYSDRLQLRANDVIVSWLPLYHDMGLIAGFLLPLIQGIPLVLMSPFDWVRNPALLMQAIDRYQGTLCWLPNFAYNHCTRRIRAADIEGLSLATMRAWINCSEPVRHDSHQLFLERFGPLGVTPDTLAVSYAMAENVFAVTQTLIGQAASIDWIDADILAGQQRAVSVPADQPQAAVQVSCGTPIEGVEVRVLNADGATLPERAVGEIAIHSDSLLTGYYRRPDLHPFTPDGWYRTGDIGYQASGEVYVIGRQKDLIINAGKNVYPQDIEAIVNTIPGIHPGRAVVFGVADEREGTELIAVVAEIEPDYSPDKHEIGRQIRLRVSQQSMVTISYVQLVEPGWLIKTSSGKIARRANREKWQAGRQRLATS